MAKDNFLSILPQTYGWPLPRGAPGQTLIAARRGQNAALRGVSASIEHEGGVVLQNAIHAAGAVFLLDA